MGSPADGAYDILSAAGVFSGTWIGRVGRLPSTPNTVVALFDYGGESPNPAYLLDTPSIQAMVRGAVDAYGTAYTKVKQVKDVLLGMAPQTVGGDHWSGVVGVGDVTFLKYDENNRPLFVMNFRIFLEPAASAESHRVSL